jgi:hypothetical protein
MDTSTVEGGAGSSGNNHDQGQLSANKSKTGCCRKEPWLNEPNYELESYNMVKLVQSLLKKVDDDRTRSREKMAPSVLKEFGKHG